MSDTDPVYLVTGGTGFIGRPCVRALAEMGCEVNVVARRKPRGPQTGVRYWTADLLDARERRAVLDAVGPTHVVHLAWTTEHGKFWSSRDNLDWLSASAAMLRECIERSVRRLVLVGTCAEYAPDGTGLCRESSTPLGPQSLYAVTKDALRRVAETAAAGALSLAWARLFHIYGPGEHPDRLVASISASLARGRPAPVGPGNRVRDFLHVDDVGGALATIAASSLEGPINVGSGVGIAIADLARRIGAIAGAPDLVRIGALPERPGDLPSLIASVERLHNEAGFRPRRSLDEGLRETLAYWRERPTP